eukprot:287812-Prymnesium_polylepis.1
MGAAAFKAVEESQQLVAGAPGLAGISLEQYAAFIGAQLTSSRGLSFCVQLAHRANVSELLQDLADASQPRF